jgi:predicted GH43/DUF377 family glycosyl hydrolase
MNEMASLKLGVLLFLYLAISGIVRGQEPKSGTQIKAVSDFKIYSDKRPSARYRLESNDFGVVLKHGQGPDSCDYLGARDIWVREHLGKYYMHYDGAGPKGWLACLAVSQDLRTWTATGPILDFGDYKQKDCASASYGTTYFDGTKWHLFYLGTPHVTKKPDYIPAFPYLTMKAEGNSPTGPWKKRYDITPFEPQKDTYYDATASPGFIVKKGNKYLMFFSASTGSAKIMRTISLARTGNLNGRWTIDPLPMLPPEEQVENSSLYYEETNKTWFLFTNHVGLKDNMEYTDAVWVYWSKDLCKWNPSNKAVVLDSSSSIWSRHIIGLPSVVKFGKRLAIFYDGNDENEMPRGVKSHMNRDVGVAWINLPIILPAE